VGKAQKETRQFEYMTTADGLSSDVIYSLLQDSRGFIWVGTKEGLNRYDGYELINYSLPRKHFQNPAHRRINALCEDNQGNIWGGTSNGIIKMEAISGALIHYDLPSSGKVSQSRYVSSIVVNSNGQLFVGTRNGIFRYNSQIDQFERYTYFPFHSKFNNYNKGERVVNNLYFDRFGKLWVATAGNGVSILDLERKKNVTYSRRKRNLSRISSNYVEEIYEDQFGVVWMATANGLSRFDRETEEFLVYRNDPKNPESITDNYVRTIFEDEKGNLFVGTKDGLDLFNRKEGSFSHFKNHPHKKESISNNNILCMLREKSGTFWIGTMLGLNYLSPKAMSFELYQNIPDEPLSLSNNILRTVVEDQQGQLWVGTMKDGINRLDPATGKFSAYRIEGRSGKTKKLNAIRTAMVDRQGQVFFGTDGGMLRFSHGKNRFEPYTFGGKLKFRKGVFALLHAQDGSYWVAEIDHGLHHFTPQTGQVQEFRKSREDNTSLSSSNIKVLFQTREGDIWLGTHLNGANRLNEDGRTFTRYAPDRHRKDALSDRRVFVFFEDSAGRLWLGTGMGLNLYLPESDGFKVYQKQDGLPGNVVLSIQEDKKGRLWLGTNRGLSCFDPETSRFVNFTQEDGLQGNIFEYQVACTSLSGQMYFGGNNGLNAFDPLKFQSNSYQPQVCFTDLKVGGRSWRNTTTFQTQDWLQQALPGAQEMFLTSADREIRIGFSALSFVDSDKNRYQYRLLPVDSLWHSVEEHQHHVLFSHLERGDYLLEVKASNNNALWSPVPARLKIHVSANWAAYRSWFLSLVLLVLLVIVGWRFRSKTEKKPKQKVAASSLKKAEKKTESSEPVVVHPSEVPDNLRESTENIIRQMDANSWYLDKKLTKSQLALHLDVSVSHLSTILRDGLQISFNDFINQYRVEAVKKKFEDPRSRDYTLLAIAEECGFNSKTSFYRTFKKFTGLTPTEYLEQQNLTSIK
jgi:ligand-binding sensor domain-containing protein/AraC-like DNA-binding protein